MTASAQPRRPTAAPAERRDADLDALFDGLVARLRAVRTRLAEAQPG